jgi:hypothetical protein
VIDESSSVRQDPARVRARARRVRFVTLTSSRGFRSSARLGLIAVYSIVFMWGGYFEWAGWTETILWSVAAILWVALAVIFIREMKLSRSPWRFARTHPSIPLLLVAPAFLWFVWMPIGAFIVVVIAYVWELRHHSAGDGFLFSFGLVIFVGVFAGLSMVEVEDGDAGSSLQTPSDAIFWAFASLLRINYGKSLTPETDDGRILATVVGVCAILGASLFTAQVVSWVVGGRKDEQEEPDATQPSVTDPVLVELAALRAELAEMRAIVDARLGGSGGAQPAADESAGASSPQGKVTQ